MADEPEWLAAIKAAVAAKRSPIEAVVALVKKLDEREFAKAAKAAVAADDPIAFAKAKEASRPRRRKLARQWERTTCTSFKPPSFRPTRCS
jgi:hypothetical protein